MLHLVPPPAASVSPVGEAGDFAKTPGFVAWTIDNQANALAVHMSLADARTALIDAVISAAADWAVGAGRPVLTAEGIQELVRTRFLQAERRTGSAA